MIGRDKNIAIEITTKEGLARAAKRKREKRQ